MGMTGWRKNNSYFPVLCRMVSENTYGNERLKEKNNSYFFNADFPVFYRMVPQDTYGNDWLKEK